tara:strand:+ start:31 stop:294 length:264 start_codon:yes stop_codon:yes gene_type:complete
LGLKIGIDIVKIFGLALDAVRMWTQRKLHGNQRQADEYCIISSSFMGFVAMHLGHWCFQQQQRIFSNSNEFLAAAMNFQQQQSRGSF